MLGILPVVVLLGFFLWETESVWAQTADEVVVTAEAGFDGKYKDGQWIPVRVTLENNGADLQGYIRIEYTDGSSGMDIHEYSVNLPAISRKEVVIYLFPEEYHRSIQVSFISGKQTLDKVKLQLENYASTDLWYGVIASSSTPFNFLSQFNTTYSTARTIPLELSDLPERAQVLKSFDVLIISNIDTGKLTSLQKQALVEWVASGGRLVLTGGMDWQKSSAGFMDTNLLPFIPDGVKAVNNLDDMLRYSHNAEPIPEIDKGIIVTTGSLVDGTQALVGVDQATPLVLRKTYGTGEVIYLTFDPGLPAFRNWPGREDFFRTLFSNSLDKPSWLLGIRNWMQAKEAALTLPNLNLPSPLLICGFLAFYTLALGPINYILVRFLKRSEWGWVTIPVMVLSFTVLIILVGTVSRGSRVILNRLAMVQVWPEVPFARVDGVLGIYSPTRSTYQAEVNVPTLLHPFPSDYGNLSRSYMIRDTGIQTTIPDLRLDVSGIEPLAFEGSIPAPEFLHNLAIELESTTAYLRGSVTNESDLKLTNAVLLYPGGTNQIGDFLPGQTFNINQQLLRAQLAGETNINPFFGYTTSYYGFPAPYSLPTDSTITDILGTSNYYDDRKIYRKYSFLSGVTNSNYGTGSSRGSGIYLVGWTDRLPLDVSLTNTNTKTQDNIVYIIALHPKFSVEQNSPSDEMITLTPGTFNWSLIEGNDPSLSPYSANIYPGIAFSFQFTPIQPVAFSNVKSLILNIEGDANGRNLTDLGISIWDFNQNSWDELDDLHWGENYLGDPERYVGTDGAVRLNFTSGQASGIVIKRADFTLVLEK